MFRKTNISYSLIRTPSCAYQGVRNVIFLENFTPKVDKILNSQKAVNWFMK